VAHRVLPDGCADLLFDLENTFTSADLVGPMSSAQVFGLSGKVELLGARLRPGSAGAFSGIPADRLLDSTLPLGELPQLRINIAQVAAQPDVASRLKLLIKACRARLAAVQQPDPVVGHALVRWARPEQGELPRISVLTRDLGLSERAFERRFVSQVGLTPVGYRRLARFRSVLRLHAKGLRDWAQLAAMTGFSDQSHLVRDCRAFTGLTPTEWATSQEAHAGFLQDGKITTA
jgi:AraC-like DNA-binding protein